MHDVALRIHPRNFGRCGEDFRLLAWFDALNEAGLNPFAKTGQSNSLGLGSLAAQLFCTRPISSRAVVECGRRSGSNSTRGAKALKKGAQGAPAIEIINGWEQRAQRALKS